MKHYCTFSEAIREGAKMAPQGFERLFSAGTTCAIGAGLMAMGVELDDDSMTGCEIGAVVNLYPYIMSPDAECPVANCDHPARVIREVILDLNDEHPWTREQIADWLEAEEEKLGFITVIESEPRILTAQETVAVSR